MQPDGRQVVFAANLAAVRAKGVTVAQVNGCYWQMKKSARGCQKCQHLGWFCENAIIENVSGWPLKMSAHGRRSFVIPPS